MRRLVPLIVALLLLPPAVGQGGLLDVVFPPPSPPMQDDCATGADAPSETEGGLRLAPDVHCQGNFTRGDREDAYVFHADAGQWVEFTTDDDFTRAGGMSSCAFGPGRDARGCYQVEYQNIRDDFVAGANALYGYSLSAYADGEDRIRYNASVRIVGETADDPHDDCGTGRNGANGWEDAALLVAPITCTGTLRGMDAWDMYVFDARRGQEVDVLVDVAPSVDHEVCVYPPWNVGEARCSTRPEGEDEALHYVDVGATGRWHLVVYRYSGDASYGLTVDVHGAPSIEPPSFAYVDCPESVVVGEPLTCRYLARSEASGVRYRVYWGEDASTPDPTEGYVAPNVERTASYVFATLGYHEVHVRVVDVEGNAAWSWGEEVTVRGAPRPQDDCGVGADASDDAANATPLVGPRTSCAAQLLRDDYSDLEDWYAVEVPPNGSLRVRLDGGHEYDQACLIAPDGSVEDCTGAERVIRDAEPGVWLIQVRGYSSTDRNYTLSVSTQEQRTTHDVALGAFAVAGEDEPILAEDGIDGALVTFPDAATGDKGMRVLAQGQDLRVWFRDADGALLQRLDGTADGGSIYSMAPWIRVPTGAATAFVQVDSVGPVSFEVDVYS